MTTTTCPDADSLKALLLGKLTGPEKDSLEQHLETCEHCVHTAETLAVEDDFTIRMKRPDTIPNLLEDQRTRERETIQQVVEKVKREFSRLETVRIDETTPGTPPIATNSETTFEGSGISNLEFLAPPQMPDELGRLGDYRVLEILGMGGMGVVLKAEDIRLKRQVALKTMKPSIASRSDAKARFIREAQATAALEHDHIVPIYQVSEDRGVPFIAMQYLRGESLAKKLARVKILSPQEIVRLGKEVALGLARAHDAGMIHRDIKPDNIWIEATTDRAKILDFGLVTATSGDEDLTHSGTVLGTPKYMAPEQALAHPVDHRCDLFSLGSVLYHCAAGNAPFAGNNFTSTLIAVAHQAPVPLQECAPELHPEVTAVIMRLLEKSPDQRPQTADEVARAFADLEQMLKRVQVASTEDKKLSETVSYNHQPVPAKIPPPKPPRLRMMLAGAGGLAALLLGVLVITIRNQDGKETVIRVPSGVEVDVDAQPGSKVTIREETSPNEQPKSLLDASPMMAKTQEADSSTAEEDSLEVDYDAERRAAQAIAEKMTRGWLNLKSIDGTRLTVDALNRAIPREDFAILAIHDVPEIDDGLLSLLAPCRQLEEVNIQGNENVTIKGIESLTQILSLKQLIFPNCRNIDGGVLELLTNWPELELVEFGACGLTVDTLTSKGICQKLRKLGLRSASLSPSSLDAIVTMCPNLESLDLAFMEKITGDLTPLANCAQLRELYCSSTQLTDENVAALSKVATLNSIQFHSPVADPPGSIQKLVALKDQLQKLEILVWAGWDPGLSAQDFAAIPQLDQLVELGMNCSSGSPTNDQLIQIAKLPKLKSLNVHFDDAPRHFDMSGIAACQRLRPDLEIVVDGLTYRGSPWPEWNREKQAAEPAAASPSEPSFDPAIERKVAERLLRLNKGRFLLGDRTKTPVPQWELAALSVSTEPFCILEADLANVGLTDDELPALKGCQAITKLILDGNANLSSAAFNRLGPLPPLQQLSAVATAIDDACVPWLSGSPALTELNLSQTKLSPDAMASLPALALLKALTLPDTVSAKAIQRVIEQAPQLSDLNAIVDDQEALDALNAQSTLATLHLAGSALTDKAVTSIKSNNRLESLVIHDPTPASISLSAQLDQLVSLGLSFDAATELGIQDLVPVTKMKRLIRLTLSGQVQPDQDLLQQLAAMRSLRYLTLPAIDEIASQALRRQRPDLELVIGDRRFPALNDWPGKFEGSPTIAAWDLPADAPQPAIYPFAPEEAPKHQQAWAKYLGVPVESENSLGMKFRLIPPGELVVDTPQSDWSPVRVALERVDKAFELGNTEVTVAQFEAFVKATGFKTEAERTGTGWSLKDGGWAARPAVTWRTPGYEMKPNLPVTVISPSDAKAFCDWLSEKEGMTYRLPTTQEWDLAGRGGGTNRLGWCTEAEALNFDWFQENLLGGIFGAQIVDAKQANPFGLHGIIGNVFEFIHDTQSAVYSVGNSWAFVASNMSYGFKRRTVFNAAADMGFRVIRDQSQKPTNQHPVVVVPRNAPLSSTAMVQRPTPIPGVRSWSVEFAGQRFLNNGSITSWSSTSGLIATANQGDSIVYLWDSEGKFKAALMGLEGRVTDMAFSPDGKRVAATCISIGDAQDNQLRVWDVASGKCEAVVANPYWIWDLAWSPDGRWIAFCAPYGLKVFETSEHRILTLSMDGPAQRGLLTFSSGSDRLYKVNSEKEILSFSIPDGARLKSLQLDDSHQNGASIICIAASPKSNALASVSNDGEILLWDLASGTVIQEFSVDLALATHLGWDPNGQRLTVSGAGKNGTHCFFIETQDGKVIPVPGTHDGNTADFSPDGERAVLHDRGGPSFHFVDLQSGEVRRQIVDDDTIFNSHHSLFIQDNGDVRYGYRVFDSLTGVLRDEDKDQRGAIRAVGPNEQWKAYGVGESEIHVLPRAFDHDTVVLKPYRRSSIWQLRVQPQSGTLATPDENFVRLWEPTTGKELAKLVHPAQVWSVEWSPNGKEIATFSDDQVLRIWDVEQRAVIEEYSNWPMPVPNCDFGIQLAWTDAKGTSLLVPYHQSFLLQRRGESKPDTLPNLVGFAPRNRVDRLLMSPNKRRTFTRTIDESAQLVSELESATDIGFQAGWQAAWHSDSRRLLIEHFSVVKAYDTVSRQWLGTLWPWLSDGGWLVIGPTGHCRGSKGIAEHVVYVAQLDDGSNITLSPQEFAKRFGWKNDPEKATLMAYPD